MATLPSMISEKDIKGCMQIIYRFKAFKKRKLSLQNGYTKCLLFEWDWIALGVQGKGMLH